MHTDVKALCAPVATVAKSSTSAPVSLPKITIEPFTGESEKFDQFWSLFKTCIDNNSTISDAAKFSYLISLLKGRASEEVSGMNVTPSNYATAKQLLKERFSSSRHNIQLSINSIYSLHSCVNTTLSIREFHSATCIK